MADRICQIHREAIDAETGDCPLCVAAEDLAAAEDEPAAPEAPAAAEADPAPIVSLPTLVDRVTGDAGEERVAAGGTATSSDGDEAFFAELREIREKGYFAILFFGFRTAGKTWLLHRMKEQLFDGWDVTCHPRFEPVAAEAGERQPLLGTSEIEFHYVYENPAFVLIDIPGEFTEFMVEWKFEALRTLLAAMNYAKAIIIALPSDVILFGHLFPLDDQQVLAAAGVTGAAKEAQVRDWAQGFRADHHNIELFTYGMSHVAGLLSYLRLAGIDPENEEEFKAGVTEAAVRQHMARQDEFVPVGGRDGLDCPTFIALTKADRVLSLFTKGSTDPILGARNGEIRARFESVVFSSLGLHEQIRDGALPLHDPWQTVRNVDPKLHGQLLHNFPFGKFDYVTAFYGHDGLPSLTREHYKRHPQRGVVEVLEWIRDARALGALSRRRRSPYSWATWARRRIAGIRKRRRLIFKQGRPT